VTETHHVTSTILPSAISERRRARAVLPDVVAAHHALIEALAIEVPRAIIGYAADHFDIMERAEHLETVLASVTTYAKAIVADTAYFSPINVHDETGFLVDAAADVVGALMNANDRLQDLQAEAEE